MWFLASERVVLFEPRFTPKRASLAYRMAHLRRHAD
jgi:hypothetical protein